MCTSEIINIIVYIVSVMQDNVDSDLNSQCRRCGLDMYMYVLKVVLCCFKICIGVKVYILGILDSKREATGTHKWKVNPDSRKKGIPDDTPNGMILKFTQLV